MAGVTDTCLVTGGAGFIGCALSPVLADRFTRVVALDNLHPQVHAATERPAALDPRVELVRGDVTDAAAWDALLPGLRPTHVVHLAAETGTGQSLTEASRHAAVNVLGTATMLDAFARHAVVPERVVLASSRAVYGEGAWADAEGRLTFPGQRTHAMLAAGQWDFPGLTPVAMSARSVRPEPTSIYGATKLAQEHVIRAWCLAMDTTPVVLRLQNVYGPGQSLTNAYTGILSLFTRLARRGESIPVYEDGLVVRDFVYVDDVVRALVAALSHAPGLPASLDTAVDVGSGAPTTILDVARVLARLHGAPEPTVTGAFRDGDVRHAEADIEYAVSALGWVPEESLYEGLRRLAAWVAHTLVDEPSDVR